MMTMLIYLVTAAVFAYLVNISTDNSSYWRRCSGFRLSNDSSLLKAFEQTPYAFTEHATRPATTEAVKIMCTFHASACDTFVNDAMQLHCVI